MTVKDDWTKPVQEFTSARQHLPHLQKPGSWYFTTTGTSQREVLSPAERDIVLNAVLYHDGNKYDLDAAVVMPDHFHLLFCPRAQGSGRYSLATIFHSIKSFSAQEIRKSRLTNAGNSKPNPSIRMKVFQDETYDHIIRDAREYEEKLRYIVMNPVKAGLCDKPEDYRWLYCQAMNLPRIG